MDDITEQLVETKPTIKDAWLHYVSILIIAIGTIIMLTINPAFGLFIILIGGFGVYFFRNCTFLEFEYTFFNGDITIAKVINKEQRTKDVCYERKDISRVVSWKNERFQNDLEVNKKLQFVDCTSMDEENSDNWYAFFLTGKNENTVLVLELNDKSKKHVEMFFKNQLQK